jgi:SAM-dependent methyltransferase
MNGLFCKYCNKSFGTNLEQMAHHKSEWHRMNVQNILEDKPLMSEETYLKFTAKDVVAALATLRDKTRNYWNTYYQIHQIVRPPSSFAVYLKNAYFNNDFIRLLDVGCGNLRDTQYFAGTADVTSVDFVNLPNSLTNSAHYIQDDIVSAIQYNKIQALQDVVYMRFFLHAVSYEKGAKALQLCGSILKQGGLICIEVRSNDISNIPKDAILQDGAYVTDHSRWLYTRERLLTLLQGYEVLEIKEAKGFSPIPREDPLLIRAIARKTFSTTYTTSKNFPLYKALVEKNNDYLKVSYLDLTKFNKLVEDNGIQYTAVGGAILGIQRHGGAIPWDADIDIGLVEPHFSKLINLKQNVFKIRVNTKNRRYHFGTLDVFLLEDKGNEWYEGENNTVCHKTEYSTIKKLTFGKTFIYAPVNSEKTLERKYGKDYFIKANIKGIQPFTLEPEDRCPA